MNFVDFLAAIQRPDWWDHAACTGLPTNWFFPDQGQKADKRAVAACARCPVREQCDKSATADDYGLFGGRSHSDRRKARRQSNAAA